MRSNSHVPESVPDDSALQILLFFRNITTDSIVSAVDRAIARSVVPIVARLASRVRLQEPPADPASLAEMFLQELINQDVVIGRERTVVQKAHSLACTHRILQELQQNAEGYIAEQKDVDTQVMTLSDEERMRAQFLMDYPRLVSDLRIATSPGSLRWEVVRNRIQDFNAIYKSRFWDETLADQAQIPFEEFSPFDEDQDWMVYIKITDAGRYHISSYPDDI